MTKKIKKMTAKTIAAQSRASHEVDAEGQAVGRVAAKVVTLLRGKNKASFTPHIDGGDYVTVINVGKVKFTGKKLVQKDYYSHTMHPGGIKRISMKKVFDKDPAEVLRKAVYGMLPKNRTREEVMKRLRIKA